MLSPKLLKRMNTITQKVRKPQTEHLIMVFYQLNVIIYVSFVPISINLIPKYVSKV